MSEKFHESIDGLADAVSEIQAIKTHRLVRSRLGEFWPFIYLMEIGQLAYHLFKAGFHSAKANARARDHYERGELYTYTEQTPFLSPSYSLGYFVGWLTSGS